jgi:hypothetical protein
VIESVPLLAAVPVGVKVTKIVQLAFCAMPFPVVEHVPPDIANGPVVEIFEKVTLIAVLLVFFTVTVIGALVVFCACAGKVSVGGVTVTVAEACVVVVPLNATACGFPVALSASVSVPELGAVPVGVKVTRIVQELSGEIPLPPMAQVPPPAIANGPVIVALLKIQFATLEALFVTVTVMGLLVVFWACAGKVRLGVMVMVSGFTPVPDRLTVCTVFGPLALLVTVNVPCTAPTALGANETLTLQL